MTSRIIRSGFCSSSSLRMTQLETNKNIESGINDLDFVLCVVGNQKLEWCIVRCV